ncbi:hypothetical protein DFH28DRAFT_1162040 [Melampsora americana]|nr:hypothetical protein DFH28DRAFT_1162040 [Melampsora americana]
MKRWSMNPSTSLAIVKLGSSLNARHDESSTSKPDELSDRLKTIRGALYGISLALAITTLALMFKALSTIREQLRPLGQMQLALDTGGMCGSSVALALAVIFTLLSQVAIFAQTCLFKTSKKSALLTLWNVLVMVAATIPTTKIFFYGSASSKPIPALLAVGISAQYRDIILLRHYVITAWALIFSLSTSAGIDWWTTRRISLFHASQMDQSCAKEVGCMDQTSGVPFDLKKQPGQVIKKGSEHSIEELQ